ncbi:MAG: hypothetical protein KDA41_11245 [Planctomycetales bacterium]|nr:hypothetical protein [Planctomycetales bacterium]
MSDQLVSPTFLFRFAWRCQRRDEPWTARGMALDEACRLPALAADLEGASTFADVRAAWSPAGLVFNVRVAGKKQLPWCRHDRCEDSDGLQVWIDTRDTHNVHRASRFCHRFVFLPTGSGRTREEPTAGQLLINRARENPPPARPGLLAARSEKRVDGYVLEAFVPAAALTGYAPEDHPRLGFFYAVHDRELGWQTLSVGLEFPFPEDPSVWGTLELAE